MRYNAVDTNLCNFTSQIRDVMAHKTPTYKYNFANSSLSRKINKDTLEKSNNTATDGKDDGKISLKEKLKNFGKGLIAPIKTMFSSPKNIAITALSAVGCAALVAATGGAAAPVLVALGISGGVFQIGKGIYKQATAKTDEQAQKAWQDIGSGTFTTGVSALAAKSALKANKVDTKGMSTLKAVGKCFKDLPANISKSYKTVSGNVTNVFADKLNFLKKNNAGKKPEIETANADASSTSGKLKTKLSDKFKKKFNQKSNVTNNKSSDNIPVKKPDVVETPSAEVPDAPKPNVADTQKPDVVETPSAEVSDAPKPNVADTPKPDVVETPSVEVSDAPKPNVADTPKPDVVETPSIEVSETPKGKKTFGSKNKLKSKSMFNGIKEVGNRFKELFEVFGLGIDKVK